MKEFKLLKIKFIIMLIGFSSYASFSQNSTFVIRPTYSEKALKSDLYYKFNVIDSIQITAFKFYISQIELLEETKVVWKEKTSYHLIDAFDEKTLTLSIPSNIHFTKLKFQLGIDSLTNVSGAMGGDLDPTKGMYWTWQSGYINLKLEGNSNLCKTRHNEFQYHLGGYQYPFNCLQTVFIPIKSSHKIVLNMDVVKIFENMELSKHNHIMSPSKEAVNLSEKVIESFNVSYE